MTALTRWQMEQIPWLIFAGYWAVTWLRVKRTKEGEKSGDRLITLVVVGLAFILLFGNWLRIGPLRQRFLPQANWVAWCGVALTWMGTAIAIWARYFLGEYWSARVTLKQGHQLIRSGPYRWVRHPIYAGMLLGCVGAALVVGEWRGVVAVVLIFAAHSRKALREESLLTKEFGEEYLSYRRRTGFLLPRWRSSGIDTGTAES
jgi:protein-S-isoprenylcysteine O-methyltransferase Ste14